MSQNAVHGEYAELALAVYVQELVQGKDVLYVGAPNALAAERLGKHARRVDLVAPRARARGTRRGGRVQARRWPTEEDAGRWDVVLVPDLPGAGLATDDEIEKLGRWLAPGGVLVAGAPEPEASDAALSYEAFFDLLDGSFEAVRMVGQAPFVGWSVVDFAPPGELEVTFDGSLLGGRGESAQRYVALCGERDVVLDAYAIVQVPASTLASSAAAPAPEPRADEPAERLREQQDALDAANVHAEELERELGELQDRLSAARAELEASRADANAARTSRDQAASQLDALAAKLEAAAKTSAPKTTAPKSTAPKTRAEEPGDEEYVRLETALHERGRELTEARAEVERRGVLVRDLVEELRERDAAAPCGAPAPAAAPPSAGHDGAASGDLSDAGVRARLDDAVQRAVAAEADKAQLAFRLDEIRGALAIAEHKAAQDVDELLRREAALRGTVRGLNARLAEVTELYQLTHARLTLAEDDRAALDVRNARLMRQVAEIKEQLELEIARVSVMRDANDPVHAPTITPPAADGELARLRDIEARAAQREGALLGALMKCRDDATDVALAHRQVRTEAERARAALGEVEERVEGMRRGYETRLAEVVAELDTLGIDAERALVQVGELRTKLDQKERGEAALRGELAGLGLRLADREAAVEDLTRERERGLAGTDPRRVVVAGRAGDEDVEALQARVAALEEELAAARADGASRPEVAELEALRAQLHALSAELEAERRAEAQAIHAEATEVEALRRQLHALSEELDAQRRAEAEATRAERAEVEALRAEAASLHASAAELAEARREIEALQAARGDHDGARERLAALEAELAGAREELASARADAESLRADVDALRDEARSLRAEAHEQEESAAPTAELRAALAARDALVGRLQSELAHASERRRELERRVDDAAADLAKQREAVESAHAVADVKVEEGARELDELIERLEQSERDRRQTRDALAETKRVLSALMSDLPASGTTLPATDGADLRRMRERAARLEADAADREVLLRSLTAQLQERDDRIRALERIQGGEGASGDADTLAARLLEMEERVARLTEELEHERDARRRLES